MFQKAMSGEASTSGLFTDLTFREKFVLYIVVILVLGMGLFPMALLDISEPAVVNLLQSISTNTSLK
jgi:NADH-quinone oxidoreductase subunit M